MGTVTLSKQNRLFWLGRYSERVYTTIQFMLEQYDHLIDTKGSVDYTGFCRKMGIPPMYGSEEDFCWRYLFDENNPYSIISSVDAMMGNGIVLRETISTPTLAYLQMAQNAMKLAAKSESPTVELQWVLDDLMAFRGSFDDSVDMEDARNITKSGSSVERISLMLRLGWQTERVERELKKLVNRLYKTNLARDEQSLELINGFIFGDEKIDPGILLRSVEGLFCI